MPSDPREELLRGDDHAQVLAAALRPAAVLGRHRQTEGAHVGQAGDDALGNVTVGAVDVFGDGVISLSAKARNCPAPARSPDRGGEGPSWPVRPGSPDCR